MIETELKTSLSYVVDKDATLLPVADRQLLITEAARNGDLAAVCSGVEDRWVSLNGSGHRGIPVAGGQPALDASISVQGIPESLPRIGEILGRIGDALEAYWGFITPGPAASLLVQQMESAGRFKQPPPLGLPALPRREMPHPSVPPGLGWLLYWSEQTANRIGFPDLERDTHLLGRTGRTAAGAWLVRLTAEPLDLQRADHLQTVKDAYERFPAIGDRGEPSRGPDRV